MNVLRKKMFWLIIAISVLTPLVLGSCGGRAGAPAPPLETPSPVPIYLKFVQPQDIIFDFSSIQLESGTTKFVGAGGQYSEEIAKGQEIISNHEFVLSAFMQSIADLQIPISETTTTFEAVGTDPANPENVKIDFADFDLNGDGLDEGCSGNTGSLPICARLWYNGYPFIAAIFYTYPQEGDPGLGEFRVKIGKAFMSEVLDLPVELLYDDIGDIYYAAVYDHVNLLDRLTNFFFTVPIIGVDLGDGEDWETTVWHHSEMSQVGEAASALKTLNIHEEVFLRGIPKGSPSEVAFSLKFFYLGRYLEGEDFWSGSIFDDRMYELESFQNLCARISTGDPVEPALADICDELGISVAGIPYTRLAVESDVIFYDVPDTPTF